MVLPCKACASRWWPRQDEIGQFCKKGYTARQDLSNLTSKGLDGSSMQAIEAMFAMPRSNGGGGGVERD